VFPAVLFSCRWKTCRSNWVRTVAYSGRVPAAGWDLKDLRQRPGAGGFVDGAGWEGVYTLTTPGQLIATRALEVCFFGGACRIVIEPPPA